MNEPVLVQWHDSIAIVTMNRPASRNALSRSMAHAMTEAIASSQHAAAIVITGADPAFCAGMDLIEAAEQGYIDTDWIQRTFLDSKVPLLAAVNGAAVTAGLEIALACDFILASDRASFADTHGLVGAVSGGGITVRLAERTSSGFARQMSYTGTFINAETAVRSGLANQVFRHEDLLPEALAIAQSMTRIAPESLRMIKRMYDEVGLLAPKAGLHHERTLFTEFTSSSQADFAGYHARIRRSSAAKDDELTIDPDVLGLVDAYVEKTTEPKDDEVEVEPLE